MIIEILEFILLGVGVGILSGFFGIGGGTILVPALLYLGFATKEAIGISVVQMVFSSIYGSYLNNKKGSLDIAMISMISIGGFFGAQLGGIVTSNMNDETLEFVFLVFVVFAIVRMFFKTVQSHPKKSVNKIILFMLGIAVGIIGIAIGVGGSIVLVPVLVGFMHVELKKAISAGLFFVIFSSISGLISHSMNGNIDFKHGILIGAASLVGVHFGVLLNGRVESVFQKKLLISFYLIVVAYLAKRLFF